MDADKKRTLKLITTLVGVVALAVGISLILPFFERSASLPSDLSDARMQAGAISTEVVRLSNEANENIKALGALKLPDEEEKAFKLLTEAESKNSEAHEKAVLLSNELKRMADGIPEVQSEKAKQILEQSVTVEISLITEFIQYSKDLNLFLGYVNALIVNGTTENRERVESAEAAINARVMKINQMNEEFLRQMEELDRITK